MAKSRVCVCLFHVRIHSPHFALPPSFPDFYSMRLQEVGSTQAWVIGWINGRRGFGNDDKWIMRKGWQQGGREWRQGTYRVHTSTTTTTSSTTHHHLPPPLPSLLCTSPFQTIIHHLHFQRCHTSKLVSQLWQDFSCIFYLFLRVIGIYLRILGNIPEQG